MERMQIPVYQQLQCSHSRWAPTFRRGAKGESDRRQHTDTEGDTQRWVTKCTRWWCKHAGATNEDLWIHPGFSVRHKWIDGSGSEISKQPWGQRAHCEHFVPPQHGLFLFLLFNQSVPCSHPSLWSLALALSPHLIYAIVQFVLFAGSHKKKTPHTDRNTYMCETSSGSLGVTA